MKIRCPECHSDAVNKYGTISGGKQRFICLVCERQFVANPEKKHFKNRPKCPNCGKPMHSYMKGVDYVRFRCSDFPKCHTYKKVCQAAFEIVQNDFISNEFQIKHFMSAVKGRPVWEAVYLANEEATGVERMLIKHKNIREDERNKMSTYIKFLTQFIVFLKSEIKVSRSIKKPNAYYWEYWDSIHSETAVAR